MAGIYIHIPYCKQACIYCNFHFSTGFSNQPEMMNAMLQELEERKEYIADETVKSIYFGGGTPSILDTEEIVRFLHKINALFTVEREAEITLEANPDDLSKEKLAGLFKAGINRLSIGVQSFHRQDILYLNRVHSAEKALACIKDAQDIGFELLTIDLIYGIPKQTDEAWLQNLHMLQSLKIPHFSAYALTVEPKTVLEKWIKLKKSPPVGEEQTANHFTLLTEWAAQNNYDHYEISNFCMPGFYAKHNTAYWKGEKYLGIGPSAHSFNGSSRQWNIANKAIYLQNLLQQKSYYETEQLSINDRFNEYIMTSLRTKWGCNIRLVEQEFGHVYKDYLIINSRKYINQELLCLHDNILTISKEGKLLADKIISDLFHI